MQHSKNGLHILQVNFFVTSKLLLAAVILLANTNGSSAQNTWTQKNDYGQLGNGTNTPSNVPLHVIGLCQLANSINEITAPLSISVFPNPASGKSFINYTLAIPARVSIDVYDVLGNKLKQLINADEDAGEHIASFDASKLANGVYLLQIHAGNQMQSQKIVVMN